MDHPTPSNPALLPAGLRDLLPPAAETEAASVEAVMAIFASHGYARVKPPLLEYEESLLGGSGAAVADQCFRIMDPDSHRMMALRADMTPQVARIAATRLGGAPRPLRLSYAGQCIRVRGQRDADRQVPQAGIELIGHDSAAADAEVILVGAEALLALGLPKLSFDLTLPTLAPALLDEAGFVGEPRQVLARALDRKDAASVAEHGGALAGVLGELLLAAGPAPAALEILARVRLPASVRTLTERLADLVAIVSKASPELRLTVDPLEFRGFRYHTGVAMTVFAPGRHEELARGGRYLCGEREAATGLTLYADAVLRAAPARKARQMVLVAAGSEAAKVRALREDGYVTVMALDVDYASEAQRLGCPLVFVDGGLQPLAPADPVPEGLGQSPGLPL